MDEGGIVFKVIELLVWVGYHVYIPEFGGSSRAYARFRPFSMCL
jgi:hypothetical protein